MYPTLLRSTLPRALALGAALLAATVSSHTAFGATPLASDTTASAPEVEQALQKFIQAWQTKNADAVVATFLPDAVATDPSPPGRFVGTDAIRAWVTGDFGALDHIAITISDLQIKVAGPVAWLSARYVFSAQMGGKPLSDPGNLSIVWLKQPDRSYRISIFHASSQPPADAGPPAAGK